ncbi:MAG: UvrD-helicase domain-containing protein [Polyangiaceae bacterium]
MNEPVATEVLGLEDDAEGARIVAEELRLLSIVKSAMAAARAASATQSQAKSNDGARLLELREQASTAKPEDLPSIFEQMHHIGALQAQRGKGTTGTLDMRSPYFGHLRLEENGKRRDILIGPRSYVDSDAGVRVVDWRHAPVSRIYYRYREGEDYEEEIGDRMVEGLVLARRSVTIASGDLVRVSGPQGSFVREAAGTWKRAATAAARLVTKSAWDKEQKKKDEPSALGALPAGREDKHLPAIASLLDPAQFDLVTRTDGLVVVQGGAGSGKTTVGLHRVAYLAFADPARFRPEKMMVVVPHDALRHYVERVLPSLGVEGVRITTFNRFADRVLPDLFPSLPSKRSDETPSIVMRVKEHAAMLRAVELMGPRKHDELDQVAERAMSKWPEGQKVVAAFKATRTDNVAPDGRVNVFGAWVTGKRRIPGAVDASSLPDATRGALEPMGRDLRIRSRAVLGAWDELLTSREGLTAMFANPLSGEEKFSSGQLDQAYEWCLRRARILAEGEREGDPPAIDSEDVPILLRLWQLLRGPLSEPNGTPIRYAHLFVDEVQDATPIALRVLLDLTGKDQSVTLAGDTAQRMLSEGDERSEFNWTRLLSELHVEHATLEPLRVSYRSTAEITLFARGVLGPLAHAGDEEPIVTRNGPPVELFSFASPGECVAFLADALRELARTDPSANIALVSRFPEQAELYYDGLARAEVPRVRRVAVQDFCWEPGVDVTDVRQTKGLEFDEVILLETSYASYPETAPARHALYVGATRAANQLWCTTSGRASVLVESAIAAPLAIATPTTA